MTIFLRNFASTSLLGAWCLCLIVSFANGEVEHGSCAGGSCEVSDSMVLLQSGLGVAEAAETAVEGVAEAPGDGDEDTSGNTDVDCASFTRGSTCRSSGCSWSGAFEGEKKEDGSVLSGYICADEEEVEEEVHDKLMNGTGSLIQMLEDESEIASKGHEGRFCRRRRLSRRRGRSAGRSGGGCPYCRRRRTVSNPTKVEANGCPAGYQLIKSYAKNCPGGGHCCTTSFKPSCNNMCAYQKCSTTGGKWISSKYPYTCEMPKPPSNPSKYCDEPNADNAGFDCLCEQAADNAQQEPFCGLTKTWSGTLAVAKAKCDASADCKFLHDWKADGQHWRACRTIKSPGDGKAAIKKKSSSGKCADLPAPTSAPTSAPKPAPAPAAPVYMPGQACTEYQGHPYIYSSRAGALAACQSRGCLRLCQKSELAGNSRCAKGWTSDWKGYWMKGKHIGCGRDGYNTGGGGKAGAYCCDCQSCTTTAPQGDADFDRMDADKSGSISREEFNKAVAAGVISDTSALKPAPAAPTSAPTAAPTSAPTSAPKPAPAPAAPAPVFTDPIFNRVDKNNNNKITEGEFNKAIAAGTIIVKS